MMTPGDLVRVLVLPSLLMMMKEKTIQDSLLITRSLSLLLMAE